VCWPWADDLAVFLPDLLVVFLPDLEGVADLWELEDGLVEWVVVDAFAVPETSSKAAVIVSNRGSSAFKRKFQTSNKIYEFR